MPNPPVPMATSVFVRAKNKQQHAAVCHCIHSASPWLHLIPSLSFCFPLQRHSRSARLVQLLVAPARQQGPPDFFCRCRDCLVVLLVSPWKKELLQVGVCFKGWEAYGKLPKGGSDWPLSQVKLGVGAVALDRAETNQNQNSYEKGALLRLCGKRAQFEEAAGLFGGAPGGCATFTRALHSNGFNLFWGAHAWVHFSKTSSKLAFKSWASKGSHPEQRF